MWKRIAVPFLDDALDAGEGDDGVGNAINSKLADCE